MHIKNIINAGMVYDFKIDSISKKEIIKSRLVAKGCGQRYGVDFSETYAPTVDPITIRMAIAWAAQRKWSHVAVMSSFTETLNANKDPMGQNKLKCRQ